MFNKIAEFITNPMMGKLVKEVVTIENFLLIGEIGDGCQFFSVLDISIANQIHQNPSKTTPTSRGVCTAKSTVRTSCGPYLESRISFIT